MSQISTNEFLSLSLAQIPRLLGQFNRNISSLSYGSFDRAFWHYRTNDISCARYQEAVYTLALLYCSDFEGNHYYLDTKILEWIRAALRFISRIQRQNGSFDEWYINEGSYVATAFLTAALGETFVLLKKNDIPFQEESAIQSVLEKSARFLMNHTEKTVMNQVSGALFAIASVGKITGKKEYSEFAAKKMDEFLSLQNIEGWWKEYGGPDIGYLTLTISYLEKYQKVVGSEVSKVVGAIARARAFVEAFIAPDKTAGGEYMSRNTEYIIPSQTLPYIGAVTPANLDDRYLCYVLYNWIETGLKTRPQSMPHIAPGETFFTQSGILRVSNDHYFLAANGIKGGSFRIYSEGRVYFDSGLEILGTMSTGILDTENKLSFQDQKSSQKQGEGSLCVSGSAKKIKEPLLTTSISIAFKLWQFLFGRIGIFQKVLKNFLRPRMVSYSDGSEVTFERKIAYSFNSVSVTDTVQGEFSKDAILMGVKSAYSAVPSSKYAAVPELSKNQLAPKIERKEENQVHIIVRTFNF